MPVPIHDLADIPFFAQLSPAERSHAAAVLHEHRYQAGGVIFLEGEPCPGLFFVKSGRVKIYKVAPSGREQVLCIMHPRTCFGGCPLFDGANNPAMAEALDPTILYVLDRAEAVALAERDHAAALTLLKIFSGRLRLLASLVERLSLRCVTARVAEVLLTYADERGLPQAHGIEVCLDLSQHDLAALVGTAREVVTRTLRDMERKGIIHARGRRIVILDRERLASLISSL